MSTRHPQPPPKGVGLCLIGSSSDFANMLKASINSTPGFREFLHLELNRHVFPQIRQYAPDAVLIDLRLAADSGFRFLRTARDRFPGARILVIADQDPDQLVISAIAAGADGCIRSQSSHETIVNDIRRAIAGLPILPDHIITRILREHIRQLQQSTPQQPLTDAEWRLLELTNEGKSCEEIATEQGISTSAVYAVNKSIYARLKINSRVAAIAWYRNQIAQKNTRATKPA